MPSANRKVLLCCFDFPPNQGVGGRRWAKLAKELARNQTDVYVLKSDPVSGNIPSPWVRDTKLQNIHIHNLPRRMPEELTHPGRSLWSRVMFRYYRWKMSRTCQGTVFDVANGMESDFRTAARKLIDEHQIENVISTGAPFNFLYFASHLKDWKPSLRLIVDYRDPWLTAQNYGMTSLTESQKIWEIRKQDATLKHADVVLCPNEYLLSEILDSSPLAKEMGSKFHVLPHFYDEADHALGRSKHPEGDAKIRMVYGGALYLGLDPYLHAFSQYLSQLSENRPDVYERLDIRIYTNELAKEAVFRNHPCVVRFFSPIGEKIFQELNNADYILYFLAEHNKNYLTSKFFEYLPIPIPFAYIGPSGHVADFISKHKLGYVMEHFENDFPTLLKDHEQQNLLRDRSFPIQEYSLSNVGKKLMGFLKG